MFYMDPYKLLLKWRKTMDKLQATRVKELRKWLNYWSNII